MNDLEMVRAGLSPKDFIEQSSSFVFQDGMVMTFNDEIACRKKVECKITGAIQAPALLEILGKLDDPELKIVESENGEVEFRGKGKRFGVTKDAEIFLQIDRVETPEKWRTLPKEFTEAVSLVQHCVSTDESRFLLTCIHIHPDYVEACDNLQILRCAVSMGLKKSVLVRGASLKHITSLGMDEIALTKSWVHFRNQAGLIFSCRRWSDDYLSLDEQMDFKGHDILIPKGLANVSDRAAVFAKDKSGDPLIKVSLSEGRIRLTGEGMGGWYKEVRRVTYEGPPMEFLIAPDLLKHISERYSEAQITDRKLKVVGGHWEYVTVLGRPEDKTEQAEETTEEAEEEKD